MINPQWLELPMSRTNFHGPKDVQAIEVRLYFYKEVMIYTHGVLGSHAYRLIDKVALGKKKQNKKKQKKKQKKKHYFP